MPSRELGTVQLEVPFRIPSFVQLTHFRSLIEPCNLLFVSPVGFVGGAERVLLECIRQVRRFRPSWRVSVLLLDEGPLEKSVVEAGAEVRVVAMPSVLSQRGDSKWISATKSPPSPGLPGEGAGVKAGGSRLPSRLAKIAKLPRSLVEVIRFRSKLLATIHELSPDIIHSNGLKAHLITALVKPRKAHVFWHVHDFYSHRPRILRWVQRFAKRAQGMIAISKAVADDTRKVFPKKEIHLLENCVDSERFSPGPADRVNLDLLAGLETRFEGLRIGLVATYANWKGQDVFLNAIAQVPDVRAYIIGGPIYSTAGSQWSKQELRALASELDIAHRVGFISFQPDPTNVYRSLDIVVHGSKRPEPFGLTIIEAMACGRPVVISDAGGAHDLFIEGETALGHEPGNVESLVGCLRRLVDDGELRENLGRNARISVEQRFTPEGFGERLIAIYESAVL
jgi:glycosyltransferase involved in cell wall biosynthesis